MISRKWLIVLLTLVTLAAVWGTVAAQGTPADASAPADTTAGEIPARGEISATTNSPAISIIDNHDPTCYRPAAGTGTCYVVWDYLYVAAEPGQYVISMTVSIDNHLRAYHAGFFQNAMYIPGDLYAPGFKITCGMPGSGGVPALGKSYSYAVRARETGGLTSANYGSVTCPADVTTVYLPLTRRP
jgi:hypothetical protein